MTAVLTMIFSILSSLPGMVGTYFAKKQELEAIKLETQRQVELAKQQLIAEMAKADTERATASLGATGMWFKYCVYWIISSPFIACLIGLPDYATMVFGNLDKLPHWYMILYTSIVAVIWGIPVQGNIISLVVDGLKTSAANRRDFKLAKLDRKAYYEAIKSITGKPIPQSYVDAQEKVFDKMDKGN